MTEFVITQTAYKKCQKPAFLTTRGGVTLVCAKQVCEQGIEMDGFCVRQGQAMKAPIAHTYTNCVPRLPLYLIWNRYHIQGIEMDGSCLRRVKGLKAPIAHPCTNCVPPAPSPQPPALPYLKQVWYVRLFNKLHNSKNSRYLLLRYQAITIYNRQS